MILALICLGYYHVSLSHLVSAWKFESFAGNLLETPDKFGFNVIRDS